MPQMLYSLNCIEPGKFLLNWMLLDSFLSVTFQHHKRNCKMTVFKQVSTRAWHQCAWRKSWICVCAGVYRRWRLVCRSLARRVRSAHASPPSPASSASRSRPPREPERPGAEPRESPRACGHSEESQRETQSKRSMCGWGTSPALRARRVRRRRVLQRPGTTIIRQMKLETNKT